MFCYIFILVIWVLHTFTTEADITLCSKYTTTSVHSWPYLYNCIVKKVSPQYVVWSTYAMYSLCTLYCSTINVKILYVQNIDLSPCMCVCIINFIQYFTWCTLCLWSRLKMSSQNKWLQTYLYNIAYFNTYQKSLERIQKEMKKGKGKEKERFFL